MFYDLTKLPISALLRPISDAASALSRLDERIARSPTGEGFIERSHFTDACASLWIDSELVHLEDLVLHDATKDIRTPTHELTIARDVLRTRRRIVAQPPGWTLSSNGLRSLRGHDVVAGAPATSLGDETSVVAEEAAAVDADLGAGEGNEDEGAGTFAKEFAAIDALLALTPPSKTQSVPANRLPAASVKKIR